MTTLGQKLATGARCILKVNGTKVAHMENWSVTRNFTIASLDECGSPITKGKAITGQTVSLSASRATLVDPMVDPVAWGMIPRSGEGEGGEAAILTFKQLHATLHDVTDDEKVIGKVIGIIPTTMGQSGSSRQIVMENLAWEATDYQTNYELT